MKSPWSEETRQAIGEIAGRHGFSEEAGLAMAVALAAGGGAMAQFAHPELGGMGQWSQGGMLMIGDMFNDGLKHRVRGLADDIVAADGRGAINLASAAGAESGAFGRWWPEELGSPSSSGSQNGRRYAVFPEARRLVIERGGRVTIHDTGDRRIGGASQQQGATSSLSFSSDRGAIDLLDLPEIGTPDPNRRSDGGSAGQAPAHSAYDAPVDARETQPSAAPSTSHAWTQAQEAGQASGGGDLLELIRKLAELRDAGVLTDEEFSAKKANLLARI